MTAHAVKRRLDRGESERTLLTQSPGSAMRLTLVAAVCFGAVLAADCARSASDELILDAVQAQLREEAAAPRKP